MNTVAEPWADEPIRRFVADSRVLFALVLETDGRLVAQHGFTRALDVMAAAALAATVHASSIALGEQLGGPPMKAVHHSGRSRQFFLAPLPVSGRMLVLFAGFDEVTSLGLVRLYFGELARSLASAVVPRPRPIGVDGADLDRELRRSLQVLFGRQ